MEKAAFALRDYRFKKVSMDLSVIDDKSDIVVDFKPWGEFDKKTNMFFLSIEFTAKDKNKPETDYIYIESQSVFQFNQEISLETIPDFFYANSIAIIFPYIRAFVSTVTLQANTDALVLPTMNLTALKDILKENSRSV